MKVNPAVFLASKIINNFRVELADPTNEKQRSDVALLTGVMRHIRRSMNVFKKLSANSFIVHGDFASMNSMHWKQKTENLLLLQVIHVSFLKPLVTEWAGNTFAFLSERKSSGWSEPIRAISVFSAEERCANDLSTRWSVRFIIDRLSVIRTLITKLEKYFKYPFANIGNNPLSQNQAANLNSHSYLHSYDQ